MPRVLNTIHPPFDYLNLYLQLKNVENSRQKKNLLITETFLRPFVQYSKMFQFSSVLILQPTDEKIYECSWSIQAFKSITMIINTLHPMRLCEMWFLVSAMNKQDDDTPFYCPKERKKPKQDFHV